MPWRPGFIPVANDDHAVGECGWIVETSGPEAPSRHSTKQVNPEEGFRVLLHPGVLVDLRTVPRSLRERILNAIEARLTRAPSAHGERLRKSLHGFWKLRVGDHRVVYEILGREVRVYGVMDRREIYERIGRRLAKGWAGPEG